MLFKINSRQDWDKNLRKTNQQYFIYADDTVFIAETLDGIKGIEKEVVAVD